MQTKQVVVHIKNNTTDDIVIRHKEELGFENGYYNFFIWEEGNFSCDCNRAIFSGDDDESCGDTRYSVNIYDENGVRIYKEFEE